MFCQIVLITDTLTHSMANNDPDVIIDKCEHYDGSFDEEDQEEYEEQREEEEYYDEEYYEDNTDTGALKQKSDGDTKQRLVDRKRFRACVVSLLVVILVLVLGAITVIALWVTGVVGGGASTSTCSDTDTRTSTTTEASHTTTAPTSLSEGDFTSHKMCLSIQVKYKC